MQMANRIYVLVWVLLLALPMGPARALTEAEGNFVQAYRSYSGDDHSRAASLFQTALADPQLVLGDYALYYLGRIAAEAGKHDEARGRLDRLKKSFPNSIWVTEASFLRVELNLAQKRYQAAIRGAAALKKTASGRAARARAAHYLGQAHEALGKDSKAYGFHQEARRRAPRSTWGSRARERVRELRRKHPKRLGLRKGDAMLREARQLQRERDYPAGAALYQRILREPTSAGYPWKGSPKFTGRCACGTKRSRSSAGTCGTIRDAPRPARPSHGSPPSSGIGTTTPGR